MALKPTTADLIGWLKLQSEPSDETRAVYDEAIACAIDATEARVTLPAGTTDQNYPQRLRTAELMLASRLAKRSSSPEGVAGFGDMGAVVHIMGRDPDIEQLVSRYRTFGFT